VTTFINGRPETCLFDRDIEEGAVFRLPRIDNRKTVLAGPLTCIKLVNGNVYIRRDKNKV